MRPLEFQVVQAVQVIVQFIGNLKDEKWEFGACFFVPILLEKCQKSTTRTPANAISFIPELSPFCRFPPFLQTIPFPPNPCFLRIPFFFLTGTKIWRLGKLHLGAKSPSSETESRCGFEFHQNQLKFDQQKALEMEWGLLICFIRDCFKLGPPLRPPGGGRHPNLSPLEVWGGGGGRGEILFQRRRRRKKCPF